MNVWLLLAIFGAVWFFLGVALTHEWGVWRRSRRRGGYVGMTPAGTSLTPTEPEEWPW